MNHWHGAYEKLRLRVTALIAGVDPQKAEELAAPDLCWCGRHKADVDRINAAGEAAAKALHLTPGMRKTLHRKP